MTDTATRAGKKDSHTIIFKNREHEKFIRSIYRSVDTRMYIIWHWCIVLESTGIQEII